MLALQALLGWCTLMWTVLIEWAISVVPLNL
jgi:hypothetical protein